jgi:hypothetical protein
MSGGSVPVFRSKFDYRDFLKASELNDKCGMGQVLARSALTAPSGTQILVLEVSDTDPTTRKVRILDGRETGNAGWVPSAFIRAL